MWETAAAKSKARGPMEMAQTGMTGGQGAVQGVVQGSTRMSEEAPAVLNSVQSGTQVAVTNMVPVALEPPKPVGNVEEVQPSDWFKSKWQEWQKDLQSWHMRHIEYRDPSKRAKVAQSKADAPSTLANGQAPEVFAEMEEEDGDELMEELEDEILEQDMDVFGLDDVCDIGGGEPLFASFGFEDWALLSLRFEVHLLVHALRRDSTDPERRGIQLEHLAYYYNKYYKKLLNPKSYGVGSIADVIGLINDTVVTVANVVESQLRSEVVSNDIFVRLTEESRRCRQRRIDGGDITAELRFFGRSPEQSSSKQAAPPPPRPPPAIQAPAVPMLVPGGVQQPPPFTKSGVGPRPVNQVVFPQGWSVVR